MPATLPIDFYHGFSALPKVLFGENQNTMEAIKTLKSLVYNLDLGPGYDGYISLIKAVDLPEEELDSICKWDEEKYQRIRFYDTDSLEGLVTCWEPKQKGPIHNYEFQQGWIKMLKGNLWLEYFKPGELQEPKPYYQRLIQEGEVVYLNDGLGFHRFSNKSGKRAVALHFYASKLNHWHVMDEKTGEITDRQVTSDDIMEI